MNNELVNNELRADGASGFEFGQLLKAGDKAVMVGCFWGTATVGAHALSSEGDSAFMWMLDPK